MNFVYDNINIYYEECGSGNPLIILHGWGRSSADFLEITNVLKEKYNVFLIDLPGFGNSDEPSDAYTIEDYVEMLKNFIMYKKIQNPIIMGHSFGGRIAIRYSISNSVKKLILISSAGIKRFSIKVKFKVYMYKLKRWYFRKFNKISAYEKLISSSGSKDYQASSVVMKRTLSNIVSVNQTKELCKINYEVLLIWGKFDKETPYKDAILMNKKIKNSGLVTFNTGHFSFLENSYVFEQVIKSYLQIGE